jgi:hypothetical protein
VGRGAGTIPPHDDLAAALTDITDEDGDPDTLRWLAARLPEVPVRCGVRDLDLSAATGSRDGDPGPVGRDGWVRLWENAVRRLGISTDGEVIEAEDVFHQPWLPEPWVIGVADDVADGAVAVLDRWVRPRGRSRLGSFVGAGRTMGTRCGAPSSRSGSADGCAARGAGQRVRFIVRRAVSSVAPRPHPRSTPDRRTLGWKTRRSPR